MKKLWDVAEAAEFLGCSETTVRRLIASGQLASVNVSARLTRLDPTDVEIYLESRKTRAKALQEQQRTAGRRRREPQRGGLNNSGYWPGMKVV